MRIHEHVLRSLLLGVLLARSSLSTRTLVPAKREYESHTYYAIEHVSKPGGASLEDVIRALDVELVEQAGELGDTYLVRRLKPLARRGPANDEDGDGDGEEAFDSVLSAFQDLRLKATSALHSRSYDALRARDILSSIKFVERQTLHELVKRAPPPIPQRSLPKTTAESVKEHMRFEDPLFTKQWHLVNDAHPEHDMNVTGLWDEGLTGKGVITSFLDDGLDFETDDLKDAFVPEYSYDFNTHVALPRPIGVRDHHGTRCAGQVAARPNKHCGVGIAHASRAAAVRILGGHITTVDEAAALNYGFSDVSIYSCSWGPRDDGATMEGANYLIRKAVVNGINHGRQGKGSIFVFASGNGGMWGDQCNFDGYTNSIYSVTVAAVDHEGKHPPYSEACAANMIVAYTSGGGKSIVTTDRKNECSETHGGTSAAAPNAVGVFALAMQARPDLTWRDIQHLCVLTARLVSPSDASWEKTASGRLFSYKYGYGALDGFAFVTAAKTWKLVKPQAWLHTKPTQLAGGKMEVLGRHKHIYHGGVKLSKKGVESKVLITKSMLEEHNLEGLEHIDVRVWINHTRRGDVEVEIKSPAGVVSKLAGVRELDEADTGFPGWRFMSLKHWGENPLGEWTIKVNDQGVPSRPGTFLGWNLALWGSAIDGSKATKFTEPVVDNALPPSTDPDRPVLNDPDATSSTEYAKPTEHLPGNHGDVEGENTKPAIPGATGAPHPGVEAEDEEGWFSGVKTLVHKKNFLLVVLGGIFVSGIGLLLIIWGRRQRKLANYSSLGDEIGMNNVGESRALVNDHDGDDDHEEDRRPGTGRGGYASRSTEDLPPRELNVQPPTGRALGFHTGFLDDDEPSPGLTPTYRDEPDEREGGRGHEREGSGRSSDEAVVVRRPTE